MSHNPPLFVPTPETATLCRGCFFNLAQLTADELLELVGHCPACEVQVCYSCGCTDERACETQCKDGVLTCEWMEPGTCSFCAWRLAEEAYNAVVAAQIVEEFPED